MAKWGRAIGSKAIGSYRVKILEPRPRSLLAFLDEAARWKGRDFLVFDERRIRFQDFIDATARAADRLAAAGVGAGQVVLINAANSPEFLVAFWGVLRRGGIVALGNAWWSGDELVEAVGTLDVKAIVSDERRDDLVRNRSELADAARLRLEDFAACFDDAAPAWALSGDGDADEERPAVLIFTSGATGKPKAAILSHRALIASIHNVLVYRGRLPTEIPIDEPQTAVLCATPLFHVGGTMIHLLAMIGGSRIAMLNGRSEAPRMLDLIARERVVSIATVPTILSRLIDHPDLASYDLSSVTAVSASGSMVAPELVARAKALLPNPAVASGSTYGMTETAGSVTMIGGADHQARPTSSGRPLATTELRVLDPDAAGRGEVLIRTPSAMSGYWGRPDLSMIDTDGWIHSGDLGHIDADGFLHITGRSKDIIIRGGENIAASVVEDRLTEHPDVIEAAVVGLPHHDLGEEVGAVVVTRAGADLDPGVLAAFVRERLSYFQVPSRWWLRDEPLPTNAVGKVLKVPLREQWPEPETAL